MGSSDYSSKALGCANVSRRGGRGPQRRSGGCSSSRDCRRVRRAAPACGCLPPQGGVQPCRISWRCALFLATLRGGHRRCSRPGQRRSPHSAIWLWCSALRAVVTNLAPSLWGALHSLKVSLTEGMQPCTLHRGGPCRPMRPFACHQAQRAQHLLAWARPSTGLTQGCWRANCHHLRAQQTR